MHVERAVDISVDYGSFAHTRVTDDQDFEGVVLARCAGCATCRSLGWPTHMRMDTTTGAARGTHKSTRQLFAVTAPSCRPIGRTPLRSAVARPCACGLGPCTFLNPPQSAWARGSCQYPNAGKARAHPRTFTCSTSCATAQDSRNTHARPAGCATYHALPPPTSPLFFLLR